jgi:hypothetical protein
MNRNLGLILLMTIFIKIGHKQDMWIIVEF